MCVWKSLSRVRICEPMDCQAPLSKESSRLNTGVGSRSLLQGIFPTQGMNPDHWQCRGILYHLSHQGSPRILEWVKVKVKVKSCPTLCDPVNCSLPGSSVYGIPQARVLEWGAISFSRGASQHRDRTQVSSIGDRRFNLWATGVGILTILQWIFPKQELNWGLLHCRQILYQLSFQGSSLLRVMYALIHKYLWNQCYYFYKRFSVWLLPLCTNEVCISPWPLTGNREEFSI